MSSITDLRDEINIAAAAQRVRLEELYNLLKAQTGYRYVKFGVSSRDSQVWSNVWDLHGSQIPGLVEPLSPDITQLSEGE